MLATAIAETSLTLDGVTVVVDAGLSRRAEFDKAAGVTRLVTHRASQAAAAQRAGRAARQGPGVAYRLWEEAAHAGRAPFDPPEMLTSDLAPLLLSLAQWGAVEPAGLPSARSAAQCSIGCSKGDLASACRAGSSRTDHATWPQHGGSADGSAARSYVALCCAAWCGGGCSIAGAVAAGTWAWWARRRSGSAAWTGGPRRQCAASRKLAERWSKRASELADNREDDAPPLGILLAEAYPDNIARRRDASGEHWLTAGGRGYG